MKQFLGLFLLSCLVNARTLNIRPSTIKKPFRQPPSQQGDPTVCGEFFSDRRRMSEDCVGSVAFCLNGLFIHLTEANEAYANPRECLQARESPLLVRGAGKLDMYNNI